MAIPASSIVDVSIAVSPQFPPRGNFSILNIITSQAGVIDATERIRFYGAIDEVAGDWAVTDEAYLAAQTYFSQSPAPDRVAISFRDDAGGETITESLNAIQDVDPGWYGFMFTSEVRDLAIIGGALDPGAVEAAAWAQARTKVFGTVSNSIDALNPALSTDIGSLLNIALYTRSFVIYSSTTAEYPEASVFGRAFTVDFGASNSTITLKFKQLPGITSENLRTSEKEALDGKRINAYFLVGNDADAVPLYGESFMAANFFFDEIHGIDWLANAIENQVFGYLFTRPTKVPLTDKGGAAIEQQVIRVLDEAVTNGLIAPGTTTDGVFLANGYITSVEAVVDIPTADKAARIGPDVNFVAILAGAVHSIQINGLVER